MTLTRAQAREQRLHNSYDISKEGRGSVFIRYRIQDRRFCLAAAWQMISVNGPTDPQSHWKTFNVFAPRQEKAARLAEALAWAGAKYGVAAWERDPWGAYHPQGTIATAVKARKAEPYKPPEEP